MNRIDSISYRQVGRESLAPQGVETASPTPTRPARLPRLIAIAAIVLAASAVLTVARGDRSQVVYRNAAQRFVTGEQFYRPEDGAAFTYPPFFVLPYVPLILLPRPLELLAWNVLNVTLLLVIVRTSWRMISPTIRESQARLPVSPWIPAVLIATGSARYLMSPFDYQSHDLIVYVLLLLAFRALDVGRPALAGLAGGLATACKATPLLLLPLLCWHRQWRAAACFGGALLVATLLPDLLSANPDDTLWVQSWHKKFVANVNVSSTAEAAGAWQKWNVLNQSLGGTLYRLGTAFPDPSVGARVLIPLSPGALEWLMLLSKLAIVALTAYAVRPGQLRGVSGSQRSMIILNQAAAVFCAMLLLSPMSSTQHFCVLFTPCCVLVVAYCYPDRSRVLGALLAATCAYGALGGMNMVGETLYFGLSVYGARTWCTLAYLIAVCVIAKRRSFQQYREHPAAGHALVLE